jgi:hypothetical protein
MKPEIKLRKPLILSSPKMRLSDDVPKCVVFFGYPDKTQGKDGIDCKGTGFLLLYEGVVYFITARHCAALLGADPFLLRLNTKKGDSENIDVDNADWIVHPDPSVDVAVVPVIIENSLKYDIIYVPADQAVFSPREFAEAGIGVGNFTYTVGLFRLMSGKKRNLPVCHFGTIAMMPDDELIPVKDWNDPHGKKIIYVRGYLVESQSLDGLSGSPVLVRPEVKINMTDSTIPASPQAHREPLTIIAERSRLRLLGLWQGAWDAPPDEVFAVQTGRGVRVPVGMGIVVPWERIKEVLDLPESKSSRMQIISDRSPQAANPEVAEPINPAFSFSQEPNPRHREDFNSLVNAAARKREPKD